MGFRADVGDIVVWKPLVFTGAECHDALLKCFMQTHHEPMKCPQVLRFSTGAALAFSVTTSVGAKSCCNVPGRGDSTGLADEGVGRDGWFFSFWLCGEDSVVVTARPASGGICVANDGLDHGWFEDSACPQIVDLVASVSDEHGLPLERVNPGYLWMSSGGQITGVWGGLGAIGL